MDVNHQVKTESKVATHESEQTQSSPEDGKTPDIKTIPSLVWVSVGLVGVMVALINISFRFNWLSRIWVLGIQPLWKWMLSLLPLWIWMLSLQILIVMVLLIVLIRVGTYIARRTGFKGKTLWEWMDLSVKIIGAFVIPLTVIGLIVNVNQFNAQQLANAQMQAKQEAATLQQQKVEFLNLQDQQQQTTLDSYINDMSDLLINQHLAISKSNDEVRVIARARTLRALSSVNSKRKGIIISFLWEAQLINGPHPIIMLNEADLSQADMHNSYLNNVNFSGALMSYADLYNCDLDGAILMNTQLDHVNLQDTTLKSANLKGAILKGATYNTKAIPEKDIEPTQWPQGFNPQAEGAIIKNL